MPRANIEYVGNTTSPGNPLWDEYIDKNTGKSTLEIHDLKQITNHDKCLHNGNWYLLDNNGNLQCKKCSLGYKIVWGIEILKNGEIIKPNYSNIKNKVIK